MRYIVLLLLKEILEAKRLLYKTDEKKVTIVTFFHTLIKKLEIDCSNLLLYMNKSPKSQQTNRNKRIDNRYNHCSESYY